MAHGLANWQVSIDPRRRDNFWPFAAFTKHDSCFGSQNRIFITCS